MTADFHLYLDSADLGELRACLPHPVVHGVTTNPTLLRRAGVSRREDAEHLDRAPPDTHHRHQRTTRTSAVPDTHQRTTRTRAPGAVRTASSHVYPKDTL